MQGFHRRHQPHLASAGAVKQQRHRYWLLKYLEARKGASMNALILDANPKRVFLLLTDILLDIDIPAPQVRFPILGLRCRSR